MSEFTQEQTKEQEYSRKMFPSSYYDRDGIQIREGDYLQETAFRMGRGLNPGVQCWRVSIIKWSGDCLISENIDGTIWHSSSFDYLNNCFITDNHKRNLKIIGSVYSNFDVNGYIKSLK